MSFIRNKFILGLILCLVILTGFKKFVLDEIGFLISKNTYLRSGLDSQQKYITELSEGVWNLKSRLTEAEKRLVRFETIEKERQKEVLIPVVDVKVYNSTGKGISVTLFVDNKEVTTEMGLNSGFWKSLGLIKAKGGLQLKLVAKVNSSPEFKEFLAVHIFTGVESGALRFIITSEGITEVI